MSACGHRRRQRVPARSRRRRAQCCSKGSGPGPLPGRCLPVRLAASLRFCACATPDQGFGACCTDDAGTGLGPGGAYSWGRIPATDAQTRDQAGGDTADCSFGDSDEQHERQKQDSDMDWTAQVVKDC